MQELVLATVIREIKAAFADDITDPDLVELLYFGVAEPLNLPIGVVQKGAASKIVNRESGGNALRMIRSHSQDSKVKATIGTYFKTNVTKHFLPGMEEETIFRLRRIIKEDKNISDSKRSELLQLGKAETFDDFLGHAYLYSLTRDNVLTPEAIQLARLEQEEYKKHPLEATDIPENIILEEHGYTEALAAAYAQATGMDLFPLDRIDAYPTYAEHLIEQREYYFAAEAVRRGTRDIYKKEEQFDVLKKETFEFVKGTWRKKAHDGLDRLSNVLDRATELHSDRCWLFRDTDWIGMMQKKGICHFLVNDGKITGWVRDDDGQAV